mmetsp:Transcript_23550/g.84041  ORF Transcript_23550/g.84041 Transcript_23550/m.84041 type:complete len:398 (-) Transcript_23550:334-1527(-)
MDTPPPHPRRFTFSHRSPPTQTPSRPTPQAIRPTLANTAVEQANRANRSVCARGGRLARRGLSKAGRGPNAPLSQRSRLAAPRLRVEKGVPRRPPRRKGPPMRLAPRHPHKPRALRTAPFGLGLCERAQALRAPELGEDARADGPRPARGVARATPRRVRAAQGSNTPRVAQNASSARFWSEAVVWGQGTARRLWRRGARPGRLRRAPRRPPEAVPADESRQGPSVRLVWSLRGPVLCVVRSLQRSLWGRRRAGLGPRRPRRSRGARHGDGFPESQADGPGVSGFQRPFFRRRSHLTRRGSPEVRPRQNRLGAEMPPRRRLAHMEARDERTQARRQARLGKARRRKLPPNRRALRPRRFGADAARGRRLRRRRKTAAERLGRHVHSERRQGMFIPDS